MNDIQLTSTIPYKPFSLKQKVYMQKIMRARMGVAEGAVRSSKDLMHCIVFANYLEQTPDKFHLASGSSLANAKLVIGDCNGFGLEHIFRGRCEWKKYEENDALIINTATGQKIVIFVGGGKSNSYQKILGFSIGGWFATEINEHYDSDDPRTSFIKVAQARQVAARCPFTLWDLNPDDPDAKIYTDYIDKYKNQHAFSYVWGHFVLEDNLTITPERMKEMKAQYDEGSIWYQRDILGKRVRAEGLIYEYFANHCQEMELPNDYSIKPFELTIGVDFGGNLSATTFVATYIDSDFSKIITVSDCRIKKNLTPVELTKALENFLLTLMLYYPTLIHCVINCDSAESILIKGLKSYFKEPINGCYFEIAYAWKTEINDRIRLYSALQSQGRYYYLARCNEVKVAFKSAVWDSKDPGVRLDEPNYNNPVDILDAAEYSIEKYGSKLIKLFSLKKGDENEGN